VVSSRYKDADNKTRLHDVAFKVDYSLYEIKDYIVQNSQFTQLSRAGAGNLRFSDYKINLSEKVRRHGVEVELGGHLLDSLSFYLTYSWQEFTYKGPEPGAQTELDERAKNRVTAGLRYNLFENTLLMADFRYQSREMTDVYDPVTEDLLGTTQIDPYEVVDLGLQQTLFKKSGPFRDGRMKFFVNNVFNERYSDQSGFPAPDQVYGVAVDLGF
jgi:outer membrane receptor protein involved in Fe transport